ncbi:MAG: monovalent cation/H(+) antiporter subunit G [Lawsonibacter sp.]|nr:monovalent cation/H(+) antiporter subunit G [Lawsonibacter sp.]
MTLREGAAALLIGLGVGVILLSILGLFRFRSALERLHAGALTDTLGLLLVLSGLLTLCGFGIHGGKLLLTLAVLWFVNPVSSHLIARMELITGRDVEPDQLTGEGERKL